MRLDDTDLPSLFVAADQVAVKEQRATVRWSGCRLVAVIVAAIGGAFAFSVNGRNWAALLSVAGFAGAAIAELMLLRQRPEQHWYKARALAESVKTLAWRYAVCAKPFTSAIQPAKARDLLIRRIGQVLKDVGEGRIRLEGDLAPNRLTLARTRPFEERRQIYLAHRLDKQLRWYTYKSRKNEVLSRLWRLALILGEVTAIVLAVIRFAGLAKPDVAGIFGAAVASGASWLAIRQHDALSTAYAVASQELAVFRSLLAHIPESGWAEAVAEAEEAISREHTLWQASRTSMNLPAE